MKKIVLWPNPVRDAGFRTTLAAAALCRGEGVDVFMPDELAGAWDGTPLVRVCPREEALEGADALLALGGDGAILHLAGLAARRGVPILGVNLGRLGFLSELEADELPLLVAALRGRAAIDARMMLSISVIRRGETVFEDLALNDATLTGNGRARCLSLCVRADGQDLPSFLGDGVVVATPTGSTAYSLSAGGPILEPYADCLVITPVCAHLSYVEPVVLAAGRTVTMRTQSDKQAVLLTDGRTETPLLPDDEVVVRRSDKKVSLLRVKEYSFFDTLNRKLRR